MMEILIVMMAVQQLVQLRQGFLVMSHPQLQNQSEQDLD